MRQRCRPGTRAPAAHWRCGAAAPQADQPLPAATTAPPPVCETRSNACSRHEDALRPGLGRHPRWLLVVAYILALGCKVGPTLAAQWWLRSVGGCHAGGALPRMPAHPRGGSFPTPWNPPRRRRAPPFRCALAPRARLRHSRLRRRASRHCFIGQRPSGAHVRMLRHESNVRAPQCKGGRQSHTSAATAAAARAAASSSAATRPCATCAL
jgi:hypothetical protein